MNLIERAFDEFKRGRVGEAERLCRRILTETPGDREANWLLRDLLVHTGRADEVEPTIRRALEANPLDAELLRLHGEALARLGRTDEAIGRLVEAIDRRPVFPKAHEVLSDLLAKAADARPRFSVSVVTPAVGGPCLAQAIASVQAQDYPHLDHLVVVDGAEFADRVRACLPAAPRHPIHVMELPYNTGGEYYNGHRIYGAAPYLVGGHFVAFLDEDNWYEPHHIRSLVAEVARGGLAWAYALRRIVNAEGAFLANDDCESLGQWPAWFRPGEHHVDTNCYLLRRDVAVATSAIWHRRAGDLPSPDRALCKRLLDDWPRCGTNGRYTVNYRVEMTPRSATARFFREGNAVMQQRYGGEFPWRAGGDG